MKKLIFVVFIFLSVQLQAQFYDLGQDPAGVTWRCINTTHFKIIFPSELEIQAQHVANMLETAYLPLSASLKSKVVRIPVVLHNRAVISNAEVPWAPKRIELYTCPAQDDYAQPWLDQLVVHEFRHVAQYSKINSGFTKVLSYLFGQQITAGVMGVFVPFWFIEGDAVCMETAFSQSGRGRVPSFEMELRTQVMQKGMYGYNKAVFGSYSTYTADRYILGYNLVAMGRLYFTPALWEQAMNRSAKMPFMIVPFSSGLKKVSGLRKVKLYKYFITQLDSMWRAQDAATPKTSLTLVSTKNNKLYTNYTKGNLGTSGAYFTVKSGMNDITRFVLIDSAGNEHRLFTPGSYMALSLSCRGNKMVWAENSYDVRWENRTYSVIKSYDAKTHRFRQLTHRSRFFAPALNHKGDRIVCMEQSTTQMSYVVVLDARNGEVLRCFAVDTGDFVQMPSWADNDKDIVFVALNRFGKRICLLDSTDNLHELTTASFMEISQPQKIKNRVYFVGAYSGIDNIYVLNTTSNQIFQVTSSQFGATNPCVSDDETQLLYSDYTANGYRLVRAVIDSLKWVPIENVANNAAKLYEGLAKSESGVLDFYKQGKTQFRVKRYSKALNLFNFHSWGPISVDADNTSVKPGFEIMSQNPLSTMVISAGYAHQWLKPTQELYAKISYTGWFPKIDLTFKYQFNKQDEIRYDEISAQLAIRLPLKLTKGKYSFMVQPQVALAFYDVMGRSNYPENAFSGYFQTLEYRLVAYGLLKMSARDINSRWGQMLDINYRHTPFGGANLGNIFSAEALLYFPGIGKHHSLNAYVGWQQNKAVDFAFSDLITMPQGIDLSGKRQTLVGKFAYEMPLFYPDWSLGGVLYIKRFRAGLYYDQAFAQDFERNIYHVNSVGASLIADFHVLRFLAPLSMGVRATYVFGTGRLVPEFVYSVNFNQLYFKPTFSRFNN
ncbi:MAG: hypothetical protein WCQ95_01080 [Bacteroidota bacterium]